MTRKIVSVILLILALGLLILAGYMIVDNVNQKKAAEEAKKEIAMKSHIASMYGIQNEAFYSLTVQDHYLPYLKEDEFRLQAHINYYIRKTGKIITINDVEIFLAKPENPDGTPRTWEDDETGIVKDFVDWCSRRSLELYHYRGNLQGILSDYRIQHRECPYRILEDLTPDQITELDKKYADPDYELVLE